MAIALSSSSDENNIAGTSSQISSESKKGPSSDTLGGCCVCSDDQAPPENCLVYCDGCGVAVHQACYGISIVPAGSWFCTKCEFKDSQNEIKCELCPSKDGAFKQTENGLWAHVVCALYIPEVKFSNNDTMETIITNQIPADRFRKSCYLCADSGNSIKAASGAVIYCHKLGCKQSFHVTCAQVAGLLCEEDGHGLDNVTYCGYCKHHFRKLKADHRKSTVNSMNNNNNNNNTSSSYLDSASDSSQDNDSSCNTIEQDKNSINKNNKLSTMPPSNLSINDSLKPSTISSTQLPAATIASATLNSHSPLQTSVTTTTTTDSLLTNNNSLVSIPTPVKTTSSSKKKATESSTISPQKKKRAPKKVAITPSSINTSTLLATTGIQNNKFGSQPPTAHFPSTHVNNSKPGSNASVDTSNNLTTLPPNVFMNDPSQSVSTISTTTTKTLSNSHSPVQTSLPSTKTTDMKSSKNSSISLTIPLKTTSRSKKNTQESVNDSSQKKKRAPRKKIQGESSTSNTSCNPSNLMTTPGSLPNSFSAPASTAPTLNTCANNNSSDYSAVTDHKNKSPLTIPPNLFMNEAPNPSLSIPAKSATHSPKQTSGSSSKTTDQKANNNSLSLTIPPKPRSRSKKKTQESEVSPSLKKKRAPRKKAQDDTSPSNDKSSSLLTTAGSSVNSFGVPQHPHTNSIPAPYNNNSKLEVAATEDVYNWPGTSTEQNDMLNNNKNNKKKPCVKDDPVRAFEELRENTWSHLSRFVLDQAQQFDIPSLIGTLYTLRSENEKLVNKVRDLTSKRDQLVAVNARLDLPGPMLTQHLNNTSPNFSSVVSGLTNSPKGSPAPSPGSAINKQSLISVVGSYNHVPPGTIGSHGFLDRSSPLIGQSHSGITSIKSSQISTPSPPIGALMAHSTSNRTGLIAVNPPYMSNVFSPMNTMGQLCTNPQSSPYYPRQ